MKNFLLGVMATVLCVSLLGAKLQDAAPKRYELKTTKSLEDANTLSSDGWRLVGFSTQEGYRYYFLLEREKP